MESQLPQKLDSDEAANDYFTKLLYDTKIAGAQARFSLHTVPHARIEAVFQVALNEADRSAAILIFALAEDLMLTCLKEHLNTKIKGGWNSVTEGNGVLATASDRIMILELLYWLSPSTASNLRLMKSVRNRFAHHSDVNNFDDQKIMGWITSMTDHESYLWKNHPDIIRKLTNREAFLCRSISTLIVMGAEFGFSVISRQEGVSPVDLLKSYEKLPKILEESQEFLLKMMRLATNLPQAGS